MNERSLGAVLAARQIEKAGEVFAVSWGTQNGRFGYEVRLFTRESPKSVRGGDHAAHQVWIERDGNTFPWEIIAAVKGLESWREASPVTLRLIGA